MALRLNKKTRKWLILLFAISLQVNVQASYACAMMPDMSGPDAECCCGVTHESRVDNESMAAPDSVDIDDDQPDRGRICIEPRLDCCIVEVAVGVSDPPTGDEAVTTGFNKIAQHKILNQIDNLPPVFTAVFFDTASLTPTDRLFRFQQGPSLQQHSPPLYKTTERYRI